MLSDMSPTQKDIDCTIPLFFSFSIFFFFLRGKAREAGGEKVLKQTLYGAHSATRAPSHQPEIVTCAEMSLILNQRGHPAARRMLPLLPGAQNSRNRRDRNGSGQGLGGSNWGVCV